MVDILAAERPDDSVAAQLLVSTGSGEVSEVNATYDCHGNVAVRDRRTAPIRCFGDRLLKFTSPSFDSCDLCDVCVNVQAESSEYARLDLCSICGGINTCISCEAGQETCELLATIGSAPTCPTGCQDCAPAAVADPGERCHTCEDGETTNEKRSTCVACPVGMAGRGGACTMCEQGKQPASNLTDCVPCAAGQYKSDGMLSCKSCPAGLTPTELRWSDATHPRTHPPEATTDTVFSRGRTAVLFRLLCFTSIASGAF